VRVGRQVVEVEVERGLQQLRDVDLSVPPVRLPVIAPPPNVKSPKLLTAWSSS